MQRFNLASKACLIDLRTNRFPFQDFKDFFTLFSKYFSTFPHGTCLLSVSHEYLALGEVYLPFGMKSQSSLLYCPLRTRDCKGSFTLSPVAFQQLVQVRWSRTPQFPRDFRIMLLAVHSPLLSQSQLVSFPPLNYMLKFGGCSRLR